MPRTTTTGQGRSDATRAALLAAATQVFARGGYEAVSTREIAAAANVHPALIGYHFGSKEGLYLAVFQHLADSMEQRIGPALGLIDQALAQDNGAAPLPERALALLGRLCDAMLASLADEASGPWGALMMREQQAPTPAFDLVYERLMKRVLGAMVRLVQTADPTRSDADARLTVVSLMGQMMVFRVARAGVLRVLGWREIGEAELAQAQAAIRAHVRRLCAPAPRETN